MENNAPKQKRPWQLIAIIVITVVPVVAAYLAYYTGFGVPEETVNNGTMLAPAVDVPSWLGEAEGEIPRFDQEPIWRLMIPITADCGEICQKNLYVTRQVHIRLAKEAHRVERYAVNLAGEQGEVFLNNIAAEHPTLKRLRVEKSVWQDWLAITNAPEDPAQTHYYLLVDPRGFAMMFYTAEQSGNQLLEDLKRILRFTPDE